MDLIWKQSRMWDLLHSFYTLMKVRVGFFDLECREMLAFPAKRTDFCNLVRSCLAGEDACRRCDRDAFQTAVSRHGSYIYQCHAGLTEVIAPIIASDEKRAGYLMIGQLRQPGQKEQYWQELRPRLKRFCSDTDKLRAAYWHLTVIDMDKIRACAHILQALASCVLLENYIHLLDEPLSRRVKTYIALRLAKPLSIPGIARNFRVGKTTLCNAVKRDFHQTVNELIRTARIDRAKELLHGSRLSVAEVAEEVGIPDYNYFTKVFKGEMGVAPAIYRKLCGGDYL
ncbi:MAG: PocR ligand-binding domain-containing protein [Treponema sp.]|jgi:AraC-like DNA-binding protein|nr:PocR ligand-binding domain-containing protein [Treponema sp.]